MLSSTGPIIMRVRISFDALRLCALVAAGAISGYLWRAAFESSTPEVRVAATPRVVHPAPAPQVVRIPASRVATHKSVARRVARPHRVASAGVLVASHPVAAAPVRPTPAPESSTSRPPAPQPKPQPKPAPAPAPTPRAAPVTSPPAPAQTSPSVQAAGPPPTQPPSPSNQPNLGNSTSDTRPGWGKGDKNHDHSGPGTSNP